MKTFLGASFTVAILVFSFFTFDVVLATSSEWVEITRFTGAGSDFSTTDYFTCDHVEWRIRWEYIPNSHYPNLTSFSVITREQGEDKLHVRWYRDKKGLGYT